MIRSEKKLVQSLTCDELCALKHKKEIYTKLENKRLKREADKELQVKLCNTCFGEEF